MENITQIGALSFVLIKCYLGDQIRGMRWAVHVVRIGTEERCVQGFGGGT
jgi:hypothetical protein